MTGENCKRTCSVWKEEKKILSVQPSKRIGQKLKRQTSQTDRQTHTHGYVNTVRQADMFRKKLAT